MHKGKLTVTLSAMFKTDGIINHHLIKTIFTEALQNYTQISAPNEAHRIATCLGKSNIEVNFEPHVPRKFFFMNARALQRPDAYFLATSVEQVRSAEGIKNCPAIIVTEVEESDIPSSFSVHAL